MATRWRRCRRQAGPSPKRRRSSSPSSPARSTAFRSSSVPARKASRRSSPLLLCDRRKRDCPVQGRPSPALPATLYTRWAQTRPGQFAIVCTDSKAGTSGYMSRPHSYVERIVLSTATMAQTQCGGSTASCLTLLGRTTGKRSCWTDGLICTEAACWPAIRSGTTKGGIDAEHEFTIAQIQYFSTIVRDDTTCPRKLSSRVGPVDKKKGGKSWQTLALNGRV